MLKYFSQMIFCSTTENKYIKLMKDINIIHIKGVEILFMQQRAENSKMPIFSPNRSPLMFIEINNLNLNLHKKRQEQNNQYNSGNKFIIESSQCQISKFKQSVQQPVHTYMHTYIQRRLSFLFFSALQRQSDGERVTQGPDMVQCIRGPTTQA